MVKEVCRHFMAAKNNPHQFQFSAPETSSKLQNFPAANFTVPLLHQTTPISRNFPVEDLT